MNEDEFDDIEERIRELRHQYPNAEQSVQLHEQLGRYKQDPEYGDRYRKAMSMLTRLGFKAGRRQDYI